MIILYAQKIQNGLILYQPTFIIFRLQLRRKSRNINKEVYLKRTKDTVVSPEIESLNSYY